MHIRQKFYALLHMIIGEFKRLFFGVKYYAEVDITDNCNLRCKHCYHFGNPAKEIVHKEEVIEVWKKRFEELHKKGVRLILLAGGEPALRMDVIELAYRTFPVVHIISNGQVKIPEKFGRLVIFLSLEGSRQKNDEIRGKGSFDRLIENYSGDKRAMINMTLLSDNYTDLEEVVKISKKHHIRGVVCNFYTTSPAFNDPLFIGKEKRMQIIEHLRCIKEKYPTGLLLTKPMIDWYAEQDHRGHCFWGDDVLHFDSQWNKRRCFSSPGCDNCGCFAGSFQNPLSNLRYIREAWMFV